MAKNKMQWFPESFKKGEENKIFTAKGNFGTVVMPTGTGKSGQIIGDIINIIQRNPKGNKVVFNISCPILKLTRQFFNDLINAFELMGYNFSEIATLYTNSSDCYNEKDTESLLHNSKFGSIHLFEKDFLTKEKWNKDFVFVSSCHKSLYKFIDAAPEMNKRGYDIISYIDEAHKVDVYDNNDDKSIKIDVDKLCSNSYKTIAVTATPKYVITQALKKYNKFNKAEFLYKKDPVEAIKNNEICPPLFKYFLSTNECLTGQQLLYFLKDAKRYNKNIYHKILVTVDTTDELERLENELIALNTNHQYEVFSTCSKHGMKIATKTVKKYEYDSDNNIEYIEEEDIEHTDISTIEKFTDTIDNLQSDCFVLHIRQLIQGIDIKSITEVVKYDGSHVSRTQYVNLIQIIGRCLRTLSEERGLDINKRMKKVGGVYIVVKNDNKDIVQTLSKFFMGYYGICKFESFESSIYVHQTFVKHTETIDDPNSQYRDQFSSTLKIIDSNETDIIYTLNMSMKKYIEETILPFVNEPGFLNYKNDIKEMEEEFRSKFYTAYNTSELLSESVLLEKIKCLFKKYNIN